MEHSLKDSIALVAPNHSSDNNLLSLENPRGEFLTFWSLEETYPQNRLRYHLGQVCMIQVMNHLAEAGKVVRAIICDPDDLTMKSNTYYRWRDNITVSMRFIDLITDKSIKVQRMSDHIIETIKAREPTFTSIRMVLSQAIIQFRDEMLGCRVSSKAENELTKYRSYVPEDEVPTALQALASKLRGRFNLPNYLLLPTAYAYVSRPSWFFSPWIVDFSAFLASEALRHDSLTILESNRNAYSWLLMQCLFEIARSSNSEVSQYDKWPYMAFLRSVPSISGESYMGITFLDGCLLLDSSTEELRQKVSALSLSVRKEYNSLFLDSQQLIAVASEEWVRIFLARFAAYQDQVSELLKTRITSQTRQQDGVIIPNRSNKGVNNSPSRQDKVNAQTFDVFLCHNNVDKPFVKKIGQQLKERGILPWLDEWELRPGFPWQRALEEQITQIKAAAVFVGEEGIGPWQNEELDGFIRQFVMRRCPVIPVLLPNAPSEPNLPVFLSNRTYIDLRKDDPDPLQQLIWGITGVRE